MWLGLCYIPTEHTQYDSMWNLSSLSWTIRHATTTISERRFQVHYYLYQFMSWRLIICCCRTTPLEQKSNVQEKVAVAACQKQCRTICCKCRKSRLQLQHVFNQQSFTELLHDRLGSQKTTHTHNWRRVLQAGCHFCHPTNSIKIMKGL